MQKRSEHFNPGDIVRINALPGLYEMSFFHGMHAIYIEQLDDSTLHRIMLENTMHIVTAGEIERVENSNGNSPP